MAVGQQRDLFPQPRAIDAEHHSRCAATHGRSALDARAAHFDHEIRRLFQQGEIAEEVGRHARPAPAYEFRAADGQLPVRWEAIYAQAWAPEPGTPMRDALGEIAAVPVDRIPIRRRR